MVAYDKVYENYCWFARQVAGVEPLSFEDWMHRREEPPKSVYQKTKEFFEKAAHAEITT